MFKKVITLRTFGVKLISTNPIKKATEALSASKRDDYYKTLGDAVEKNDMKPPGWNEALPFESIPGPKPLPLIGNIWRFLPFVGEYYNMPLKDLYQTLKKKYGNVVILKGIVGRDPIVILFDVNDMEKSLRNEGTFPIRRGIESFKHYRSVTRKDVFKGLLGVLNLQGEEWFEFRRVVNPILMQPRTVQQYIGSMDKVANELIENMRYFARQNESSEMPDDFQNELYKWSLESIGVIALDTHLGCLNLKAPKDSDSQKLISNVNNMFLVMYNLDVLPPVWKVIETPSWKRFVKIMDSITETTTKYIEEAMSRSIAENIPEQELSILQRLAKQDKNVAVAMVMDMLIAGIDTTGKTMASALYFLAKNPEKQQRLRDEVCKNVPMKKSPITKEVLSNSPYLKAVIKETTRIAPISIGNLRSSVKDLVLGGYKIPKGSEIITLNIISANSDTFKDPEKFIPERWLRKTEDDYSHKNVHPFAYLPFGFGPRSCIGKRLANLELEIGIAKIIRNFELSWHRENMIFSGKFLYGPERPVKVAVKEL